jgi:hypothetical protein
MRCPLNPDIDLQAFRVAVFADMYDMAESPEAFDVDQYMQEMYELVFENTKDPALALDYARFIPETTLSLLNTDKKLSGKLMNEKGLNLNSLMQKVIDISNYNKDQLKVLNNQLAGKVSLKDTAKKGKEVAKRKNQEKKNENQLSLFDPEIIEEAAKEEPLPTLTPSLSPTLVEEAKGILDAQGSDEMIYPLTAFATRNVDRPTKHSKFISAVQKQLLRLFKENKTNNIFLAAVPTSEIIANLENKDSVYYNFFRSMDAAEQQSFIENDNGLGVILVVTDQAGLPITFNDQGLQSKEDLSSPAFLFLNSPKFDTKGQIKLSENDIAAIEEIKQVYKKHNQPELAKKAEQFYIEQLKSINKIREYVRANPKESVKFTINGGFLGAYQKSSIKNKQPLAGLEETINLQRGKYNSMYFTSSDLGGKTIVLERPTLSEADMLEDILSLLVDDITLNGKPISSTERKNLFFQFYYSKKETVQLASENGKAVLYFKYKAIQLDQLNDQQKQTLKEELRNYFTEINDKGYPEQHTYLKSSPQSANKQISDISIENGVLTLTNKPYEQFVKEKFYSLYKVENGRFATSNPYITFELAPESEGQVFLENKKTQEELINELLTVAEEIEEIQNRIDERLSIKKDTQKSSIKEQGKLFRIFEKAFYEGNNKRHNDISNEQLQQLSPETKAYLIDLYERAKPFNEEYQRIGKVRDVQTNKEIITDEDKIRYITANHFGGFGRAARLGSAADYVFRQDPKYKDLIFAIPSQDVLNNINKVFNAKLTSEELNIGSVKEEQVKEEPKKPTPSYSSRLADFDTKLDKTLKVKGLDVKATKQQIKEAKKWYEKSAISQFFKFEEIFDMVNTDDGSAVARWTLAGITLYKGSDYSDLYHEAWHAFTQTFMNSLQRQELYEKLKTKSGTFTDHLGQTVTFKDASDLQLEEHLAEQFREYMLNPSSKKITKEEKSLFRRVLQALRKLFGDRELDLEITNLEADLFVQDIFEKLRIGKLYEYTFDIENFAFPSLDKGGVKALQGSTGVQQLNYNNTMKMVGVIDSLISEWIDLKNAALNRDQIDALFDINDEIDKAGENIKRIEELEKQKEELLTLARQQIKATYKYTSAVTKDPNALLAAYNHAAYRIARIISNKQALYAATENIVEKEKLKKQLDLLEWSLKNFGNLENIKHVTNRPGENSRGLISMHIERSATFFNQDVKVSLDFENVTEEQLLQGKLFEKTGNDLSMVEIAKPEVIFFLKQLYSYNKEGLVERDDFGLPKQADFGQTWNKLARLLVNTPNIDQMYLKLQAASVKDPQIKQLLSKLGRTNTDSNLTQSLISNFFNTFGMANVPLIQTTIRKVTKQNPDGTTSTQTIASTGRAFNSNNKIAKDWERQFKEPSHKSKYIKRDEKGSYLDVDAFLNDYNYAKAKGNLWQFYNDLGILLSDNEDLKTELQDPNNKKLYSDKVSFIFTTLKKNYQEKNKRLADLNELAKSESVIYNNLINLESKYSNVFTDFMVTNAEGNAQFEHTLNNTITMMVNGINNVENYLDILAIPHLAHLNVDLNPFAESSMWLKSMFNLEGTADTNPKYGERRKDTYGNDIKLEVVNLSGIITLEGEEKTQEGIASARADEFTKFILDMHLGYDNSFELMRHADKSTSYGIRLTGETLGSKSRRDSYLSPQTFKKDNVQVAFDIKNRIVPYLIAELKRMRIARTALKDNIKDFDFAYLERGKDFVIFSGYLSADTQALLEKEIVKNESLALEDFAEAISNDIFEKEILKDTRSYFNKQYVKVDKLFKATDEFISDNIVKNFIGKSNITKDEAKKAILQSQIVNSFINNLESMSFIYGDIAQYKLDKEDFHKRNAGAGSTGKLFRTDKGMQDFINGRINQTYAAKLKNELGLASLRTYDGTFNTAVISDNKIPSVYAELRQLGEAYNEMEEADGQGIIAFDSYRTLKIAEGSWLPEQEALYQDIINEREIDETKIQYYFPAYKTQYWGPLKTDLERIGLPVTAFHKFSLYPAIPNVIKGKNMEILHKRMIQEGIDYVVFKSGSKVGTVTETQSGTKQVYKKDSRELVFDNNYDPSKDKPFFTKNVIFLEYLKNQLEINDKAKGQTIFSTQLRKLVIDGLMEFGVPVDYKTNIKDPEKRIKAWENEKNKEDSSPYYKLIRNYEQTIEALTKLEKDKLLKELNWTENEDGTLSGDKKKLIDFVVRELSRKELGEHELEYLLKGGDLSLSLNAADVEKMLNAIVVKKLVKQKVNGEALIQVANTFMEDAVKAKGLKFKNPTKKQIEEFGSNDLPFYTKNKDGSTNAMKVKVALQNDFKNLLFLKHNDGQEIGSIERLNEMIKDEEWLNKGDHRKMITMTAVRIPVQGLNSMEFMEVYEFLPASASGTIILPSEIVAKSGADFDIDKLTVMMPNIKAKVTKENKDKIFWKELAQEFPDLDFSYNNVQMIFDALKSPETYKFLNEEDIAVANAIKSKANVVTAEYSTGDNKSGLENKLLESIVSILSLPVNREALLTPNSTALFTEGKNEGDKSLVDALAKDEEYNGTTTFEIAYNLKKHQENSIGKAALGLGAVDNTYNTLMNRVGAYLNKEVGSTEEEFIQSIFGKIPESEQKYYQAVRKNFRRQKIFLPHNTIDGNISLSHSTSKGSNQSISGVINQMINGWVDVARGAWIFNVQGNKEVAPTLLFMIQAGVPVDTAVYFVSNPLVKEYVNQIRKAQSPFAEYMNMDLENPNAFKAAALRNIFTNPEFGFRLPYKMNGVFQKETDMSNINPMLNQMNISRLARVLAVQNVNKQFNTETLKERAENYKEGDPITEADRDAFLHFLELEEMGKGVRDIKMNMNFDTNPDQSLYAAEARIKRKGSLEYDNRFPSFIIEKLENESPISAFYTQPFQIKLIGGLFPLRNHKRINKFIDDVELDEIKRNGWNDRESFAKDFKNEFINFIYQNELRNFDVRKLSKPTTNTFNGFEIERVNVASLKHGAAFKDGKLFISMTDLARQYASITKKYNDLPISETLAAKLQKDYQQTGLAPISPLQFRNFEEYVEFVIERERLRSVLSTEKINNNLQYQFLLEEIKDYYENNTYGKAKIANYSPEVKERFIVNYAKETFLKNKALQNIYNNDYMFKNTGQNLFQKSYADRFLDLNNLRFPQLKNEFLLLNYLEYVESPTGYRNLKLSNPKLTADQKNVFFENLEDLTDEKTLKEKFPSLEDNEIKYIIDFFNEFSLYAYLQTGLNTKSSFNLSSIVDPEEFTIIAEEAKAKALNILNSESIYSEELLQDFYRVFNRTNGNKGRAVKGRGVNYKIQGTIFTEKGLEYLKITPKTKSFVEDVELIETQPIVQSTRKTYSGKVTSLQPNQIFVFGSNPLGINGNPAKGTGGGALVAYQIAGVKQGEKMDNKLSDSGKAWGITTVTAPGKKKSKTPQQIIEGIKKLYEYANNNPRIEVLVADYSGPRNLNGYTGQEMADMFSNAGPIPSNIVFNENFDKLIATQPTVQSVTTPKNRFTVKPKQAADKKAKVKAKIATQYIGFAEGIFGSSTALYAEQIGQYANTGNYSSDDVIFVSIPGKRGSAELQKQNQDRTIKEAIKAVEAGATIITDNKAYIDSSSYNTGEKRLFANMQEKGYTYSEVTVDGQILGTWSKPTQPQDSNPNIVKNSNGLIVIKDQLNNEEGAAMVESFKPVIEETSFKQTGGSVSWGFGLQWMRVNSMSTEQRKGLIIGKQLNGKEITQEMKDKFINGADAQQLGMPLYGYTSIDKNGNPLPNIPTEIITMLAQKGIDISEYDASYNSVYDKKDGGSLIIHQDNTELNESPIITISLGRPMKFITYELNDPNDFNITDPKNTAYNIVKNVISGQALKNKIIDKPFKYGELTPGNIMDYAKQLDKIEGGDKYSQQVLDALKAQFKGKATTTEYTLENGAILVFSGNNRNVLHEIVFDEASDKKPMPEGFPELTVTKNRYDKKTDSFLPVQVKTDNYRVVLTLRKVQGTTVNNIDTAMLENTVKTPAESKATEGKYQPAKDVFDIDSALVIEGIEQNPDVIFVYEGAETEGLGTGQGEGAKHKKIKNVSTNNVLPLTVNRNYALQNTFKDVKDEAGNMVIDPKLKELIDNDIQTLLAYGDRPIRFSSKGYGKELIKQDKKRNTPMPAPQAFIYLSEQLLEKFGYINPGFLSLDMSGNKPGIEAVQEAQEISDAEIKELNREAVLDLIKLCKS